MIKHDSAIGPTLEMATNWILRQGALESLERDKIRKLRKIGKVTFEDFNRIWYISWGVAMTLIYFLVGLHSKKWLAIKGSVKFIKQ